MHEIHFIVGCPRSGTYLLSNILNRSRQIAIPTETHFIPLFDRFSYLFGDLNFENRKSALLAAIFSFLEIWLVRAEEERDFNKMAQHSLLAIRDRFSSIEANSQSYSELVFNIFQEYASLKGAPLCGDKSAFYRHIPPEKIDSALNGHAKFIHIVRDGRDVCLSWMKLSMGPKTVAGAAQAWREHVAGNRLWGVQHPRQYLELRFEDLLSNPEVEIRRVCEFIGIEFSPGMLDFRLDSMAQAISNSSTHQLLAQPLDPNNTQKWKSAMSEWGLKVFQHVAGKELETSGYPIFANTRAWEHIAIACLLPFARIREFFSYKNLRLYLKSALPLVALLGSKAGFPIEKLVNAKIWLAAEGFPVRLKNKKDR